MADALLIPGVGVVESGSEALLLPGGVVVGASGTTYTESVAEGLSMSAVTQDAAAATATVAESIALAGDASGLAALLAALVEAMDAGAPVTVTLTASADCAESVTGAAAALAGSTTGVSVAEQLIATGVVGVRGAQTALTVEALEVSTTERGTVFAATFTTPSGRTLCVRFEARTLGVPREQRITRIPKSIH